MSKSWLKSCPQDSRSGAFIHAVRCQDERNISQLRRCCQRLLKLHLVLLECDWAFLSQGSCAPHKTYGKHKLIAHICHGIADVIGVSCPTLAVHPKHTWKCMFITRHPSGTHSTGGLWELPSHVSEVHCRDYALDCRNKLETAVTQWSFIIVIKTLLLCFVREKQARQLFDSILVIKYAPNISPTMRNSVISCAQIKSTITDKYSITPMCK